MEYLLCPERFDKNGKIHIRYYRKNVSMELEAILKTMTNHTQSLRYQNAEKLLHIFESYRKNHLINNVKLALTSWI